MTASELIISEQSLTFAKTVPGKAVFLVLRVAADEKDTHVTASTDLPTVFQLASDKRPIFGSTLSLTLEPAGTYIHIRYQPDRSGVHEGRLMLESAGGTRTVLLSGRCSRMPAVSAHPDGVLTRTIGPQKQNPTTGRTGMTVAGAAVLIGLLYTGIVYRCELMPSLCQQAPAADVPAVTTAPAVDVTDAAPVPLNRASDKPAMVRRTPESRQATPRVKSSESEVRPTGDAASVVADATQSAQATRSANRSAEAKTSRVIKSPTDPIRPVKAASESEESDLERELNGRSN